jgi:hypothetical protein
VNNVRTLTCRESLIVLTVYGRCTGLFAHPVGKRNKNINKIIFVSLDLSMKISRRGSISFAVSLCPFVQMSQR